ncbi:MAG: hypothetical protein CMJ18_14515 [Phycisphaeraceae bacterium]|nr:hypothetical protein [Phycisphaeraceae bacterium]
MALISRIGRRSTPVRLLLLGMYLLLTLGAVMMVYPFVLMISTATTSKADVDEFQLVPRYWHDDLSLFKKVLVDAFDMSAIAVALDQERWFRPRDIKEQDLEAVAQVPESQRRAIGDDWRRFLDQACPDEVKVALFTAGGPDSPLSLEQEYFDWLESQFGSIAAANHRYDDNAETWKEFGMPAEHFARRPARAARSLDWRRFLSTRTPQRTGVLDLNRIVFDFLVSTYGNASRLEELTGFRATSLTRVRYEDIETGRLGIEVERQFYLRAAPLRFVALDLDHPDLRGAWQRTLREADKPDDTVLTRRIPEAPKTAAIWSRFIQTDCPLDALGIVRPETAWRSFLEDRYGSVTSLNAAHGTSWDRFEDADIGRSMVVAHYDSFLMSKARLRWRYLVHNFKTVLGFVAVHGRAMQVTLIYVLLTITTTLTVNPLAAYAMSRFRLRETYHILVFLLATMAFPGEVLMIPSFLLIKSFPLGQIAIVVLCLLGFAALRRWLGNRLPLLPSATLALVVVLFLAGWAAPRLADHYDVNLSVTLMNTFWALILPAMANGYGIFLLKGFFDSLPPELYESGLIDGAGELRMFWQITIPLCKPILAVMALGAFITSYGAFMHAFLVCQDPEMWTLMVFLYQFQQIHTVPMVMASLVVAAVPTLVVFVLCQRVILRGIVIPTFK